MDFSNIEESLFQLAQRTKARGPSRWQSFRRMFSGVAIAGVSLASAFAFIGSSQSIAMEPTVNSPSSTSHNVTVEQQPADLADSVV